VWWLIAVVVTCAVARVIYREPEKGSSVGPGVSGKK
jgi:hypothetical protein